MKYKLLPVSAALLALLAPPVVQAQNQGGTSSNQPAQAGSSGNGTAAGQGQGQWQRNGGGQGRDSQFQQHMLQRYDTNHDGILDDNERAQMRADMQQRRAARQNGGTAGGAPGSNGAGSSAGGSAAPGSGVSNAAGGPGPGGGQATDDRREAHRQRMLQKFDTNHDGVLDATEKAQMRAAMQRRREMKQNGGGDAAPGSQQN